MNRRRSKTPVFPGFSPFGFFMRYWFPEFDAPLPFWFLLLIALGMWIGTFFLGKRRKKLSRWEKYLQMGSAFLFFLCFGQLVLVERHEPKKSLFLILDDSRSMELPIAGKESLSRFEVSKNLAGELIPLLEKNDVSVHFFTLSKLMGNESSLSEGNISKTDFKTLSADFPSSPLNRVLDTLFRFDFSNSQTDEMKGVLLLTDGISSDGFLTPKISHRAKEKKSVFFSCVLGEKDSYPQLHTRIPDSKPTVLCGEESELRFQIFAVSLPTRKILARLTHSGNSSFSPPNEVLAEKEIFLDGNSGTFELCFSWQPEVEGEHHFQLEFLLPDSPEAFLIQPITRFFLNAAERKRRVLLITASPSWEFRSLRNLLIREPSIQLETWFPKDSFLSWDSLPGAKPQPLFPSTEELKRFDALILDSVSPIDLGDENINRILSAWNSEQTEETRRHGLVLLAGRKFQPKEWEIGALGPLFPFSFSELEFHSNGNRSGAKAALTSFGKVSPVFAPAIENDSFEKLKKESSEREEGNEEKKTKETEKEKFVSFPAIFSYWTIPHLLPGAQVLAEIERNPLIIHGKHGRISTVFHASDNFWRWKKYSQADYRHYWLQTLHGLCVEEKSSPPEQNILSAARLENSDGSPSGKSKVSTAEISLEILPEVIPGQDPEFRKTLPEKEEVEKFARQTGGSCFEIGKSYPQIQTSEIAREILLALQDQSVSEVSVSANRLRVWKFLLFPLIGLLSLLWIRNRQRT